MMTGGEAVEKGQGEGERERGMRSCELGQRSGDLAISRPHCLCRLSTSSLFAYRQATVSINGGNDVMIAVTIRR